MALVDSTAAFSVHCDNIDGSGNLRATLTAQGLNTYSKLAFAIGPPQKPPTDDEFNAFCANLNAGVDMTLADTAAVKRMHFESLTIVIANLKTKATTDATSDVIRKLPAAEKQARLITQQRRLVGVTISGELQPSHALIDLVASMCETNYVIWVPPSRCTKRDAEVQMISKEKTALVSVGQQVLKVNPAPPDIKADASTELQWQWAMQRRGIAMDQSGLISWNAHQLWLQQLLWQKNHLWGMPTYPWTRP